MAALHQRIFRLPLLPVFQAQSRLISLLLPFNPWKAAEACFQTLGGFAFASEYDVERKWRETRLFQTAPISSNMVLNYIAQHVLKLPRSY